MNTSELKPCPFCGRTPVKRHSSGDERDGYADRVTYSCSSCGCSQGAIGDTSKGGYADNSKVDSHALARWNTRAPATTCPGHGRSECVSCCWPKGAGPMSGVELGRQLVEQVLSVTPENYAGHSFGVSAPDGSTLGDVIITVVKPDGKGPPELRIEAESRVTELANLLTLARPHVPVTDPLRGLINANLFQHLVEQDPSADFKDAAPEPAGYTAVDMGTAAADGYRDGKANPELQMQHVAQALEAVRGGPVLTSNQCYDLARALNGIQRDRVKS